MAEPNTTATGLFAYKRARCESEFVNALHENIARKQVSRIRPDCESKSNNHKLCFDIRFHTAHCDMDCMVHMVDIVDEGKGRGGGVPVSVVGMRVAGKMGMVHTIEEHVCMCSAALYRVIAMRKLKV